MLRFHHLIFKPISRDCQRKRKVVKESESQTTLPPIGSALPKEEVETEKEEKPVDYSKIKPPQTSDPEKILFWYATNIMNNTKCESVKTRINAFRPPFSELTRVEFFENVPHGMKLNKREVLEVSKQAAMHEVKPGWIIMSIWLQGKMVFSPSCIDPAEQLSNAVTSNLPYTICFFKDPVLWKRIKAAIKFVKEFQHQKERREAFHNIPCLSVKFELSSAFSKDSTQINVLKEAIVDVLKSYEVHKRDVKVRKGKTNTICTIDVNGDISVSAVHEKLDEAVEDGTLAKSINSSMPDGGNAKGAELGAASVAIKWPLERIQAAIYVEYQYMLPMEQLEDLVQAVAESRSLYASAWTRTRSSEAAAVAQLVDIEPMSCFQVNEEEIKLMSNSEGKAQALKVIWVAQEAGNLTELLGDARKAQKMLKSDFCKSHSWGETGMNDTSKCPLNDDRRTWNSGADDLAPSGSHFDPGTKSSDRVLEKAKSRQTALDDEPPVSQLVDVSRLGIVFDSVASLLKALQQVLKKCDVVWLDNKFRNPSCVGYRDINIGVRNVTRSKEGEGRKHISEVQLLLRTLYNVKMGDGHKLYETIRSLLAKFGVQREHEFAVQMIILRELDSTAGKAALEEMKNADKLKVFIEEQLPEEAPELLPAVDTAVKLAKALVETHSADEAEARKAAIKKEAFAWIEMGNEGGGTMKGVEYTRQECYLKALLLDLGNALAWNYFGAEGGGTVKNANYTQKQCYLKALELDPACAEAWANLGSQGGGIIKGANYSSTDCVMKALELNSSLALAWRIFGSHGGGTTKGATWTSKDCYQKAVDLDMGYALAWSDLGAEGGGNVRGATYTDLDCYAKAVELDPQNAVAWNSLGLVGQLANTKVQVKGTEYNYEQCFEKAVGLNPGYALAWVNLGFACPSKGQSSNLKALESDLACSKAWNNLAAFATKAAGVKVNGTKYTHKDCFVKALELDQGFAIAWINLMVVGGGMVKGVNYTSKDCCTKALEAGPADQVKQWLDQVTTKEVETLVEEREGAAGHMTNSSGKIAKLWQIESSDQEAHQPSDKKEEAEQEGEYALEAESDGEQQWLSSRPATVTPPTDPED